MQPVTGPVRVELTAQDGRSGVDGIWFTIDGGADTPYTGAFDVTGTGPVQLSYWSVDVAGNVESAQRLTLVLDPSLPTNTPTHTPTGTATPTGTPTRIPTASPTPGCLGDVCINPSDCRSTFCVDGICCDSSCSGPLDDCNQPGREGRCTQSPAAPAAALPRHGLLLALFLLVGVAALRLRLTTERR